MAAKLETGAIRDADAGIEGAFANVELRLRHQQGGTVRQHGADLPKQAVRVAHLVNHPEGKRKAEATARADSQVVGVAFDELGARGKPVAFEALSRHLEHARLEVDADDTPLRTHEQSEAEGVEAGAAADVQHRHTWSNVRREHLLGVVKAATNRIVEAANEPPRADMSHATTLARMRRAGTRNVLNRTLV